MVCINKKKLIEYYENLPDYISIRIGKHILTGKQLAYHIKNNTKIGKLLIKVKQVEDSYNKKLDKHTFQFRAWCPECQDVMLFRKRKGVFVDKLGHRYLGDDVE